MRIKYVLVNTTREVITRNTISPLMLDGDCVEDLTIHNIKLSKTKDIDELIDFLKVTRNSLVEKMCVNDKVGL